MLGNVNVLLQYNKNILLLLSAVDYRNYSLPKSCVVVVDQVSQFNIGTIAITVRNRNFEPLFNQELWISVKVVSGTVVDIRVQASFNIQHILQCPLTKHLRCPLPILTMSSMSIDHITCCPYQPFPISKLINFKADHSTLSTNITRQQPMFQMLKVSGTIVDIRVQASPIFNIFFNVH